MLCAKCKNVMTRIEPRMYECTSCPSEVDVMFDAAIEAVSYMATWFSSEEAAKEWLCRVKQGRTDKSLGDIKREINER